jgi:hypothetical protein
MRGPEKPFLSRSEPVRTTTITTAHPTLFRNLVAASGIGLCPAKSGASALIARVAIESRAPRLRLVHDADEKAAA